jgi:hypothetical protein
MRQLTAYSDSLTFVKTRASLSRSSRSKQTVLATWAPMRQYCAAIGPPVARRGRHLPCTGEPVAGPAGCARAGAIAQDLAADYHAGAVDRFTGRENPTRPLRDAPFDEC